MTNDYANSIQIISDEGYIMAGYSNSYGVGGYDFWILKTDINGDIPDATFITVTATSPYIQLQSPNNEPVTAYDTNFIINTTTITPQNTNCTVTKQAP